MFLLRNFGVKEIDVSIDRHNLIFLKQVLIKINTFILQSTLFLILINLMLKIPFKSILSLNRQQEMQQTSKNNIKITHFSKIIKKYLFFEFEDCASVIKGNFDVLEK